MNKNERTTRDLPKIVPILPIYGAVLLPRAQLPVPISEAEYITLATTTLKEHPYLGVVQPALRNRIGKEPVPLFKAGCLGKITDVNETEDNKISLTLAGICRFDLIDEQESSEPYRLVNVSYDKYNHDLVEENDFPMDRPRLLKALESYFKHFDLKPNWQEIDETSNERLITALTMICPFEASEKQALLEQASMREQSEMITTLIEIGAIENDHNSPLTYH